jgi:signal transduction histidine kinase
VLIEDINALVTMRTSERVQSERMSFGIAVATLIALIMFVSFARRPSAAGPQLAGAAMPSDTLVRAPSNAPTELAPQFEDLDATVAVPAAQAVTRAVAPPAAAARPVDMSEQIQTEFLAQLVKATARRLGSHIGLMKEVYKEVSKGVAASQATLVVGDNRSANSAIIETKATLGELGDLLDLNAVPKLVEATSRTIDEVERASSGFHLSIQPSIESERASFEVAQCVELALQLSGIDNGAIAVRKNLSPVGEVNGSIDEMAAALRCILDNARESLSASGDAGALTVQTTEELGAITVTFSDNGEGIDPEKRQACTQAFVTTKEGHEGLGLSVAEYIIRKHGGRLSLNSVLGKGTVVRVVLPADGDELPPE